MQDLPTLTPSDTLFRISSSLDRIRITTNPAAPADEEAMLSDVKDIARDIAADRLLQNADWLERGLTTYDEYYVTRRYWEAVAENPLRFISA